MKRLSVLMIFLPSVYLCPGQDLPFYQMNDYPDEYSASTVLARYVDGLGFRFYWATEGLEENDYRFRPDGDGRSVRETLEHIYSLSLVVENTLRGKENIRPEKLPELTNARLRAEILLCLEISHELLLSGPDPFNNDLVFTSGENEFRLPFWNLINGPLSDAMYHTGQLVVMRRMNGNPVQSGINVLTGKKSE